MPLWFITGPVRSGKSRFAGELARHSGLPVTYVATAVLGEGDHEWEERLARHRAERDPSWTVIETARAGAPSLEEVVRDALSGRVLLIESTGTWLAQRIDLMLARTQDVDAECLERESARLVDALRAAHALAIVVGDEVGWSIVPEHRSSRLFRDVLGRMQQRLALAAERAYLMASGNAINLRELGIPLE